MSGFDDELLKALKNKLDPEGRSDLIVNITKGVSLVTTMIKKQGLEKTLEQAREIAKAYPMHSNDPRIADAWRELIDITQSYNKFLDDMRGSDGKF